MGSEVTQATSVIGDIDKQVADRQSKGLQTQEQIRDVVSGLTDLPPKQILGAMATRGYTLTFPNDTTVGTIDLLRSTLAGGLASHGSVDAVYAQVRHEFSPWFCRNWNKVSREEYDISGWTGEKRIVVGQANGDSHYEVFVYPLNFKVSLADDTPPGYQVVPVLYDDENDQIICGQPSAFVDLLDLIRDTAPRQFATEIVHSRLKGEAKAPVPSSWKQLVSGVGWGSQTTTGDELLDQGILFPEMCFIADAHVCPAEERAHFVERLQVIGHAVMHTDWTVLVCEPEVLATPDDRVIPDRYLIYGRSGENPTVVRYVDRQLPDLISAIPSVQLRSLVRWYGADVKSLDMNADFIDLIVQAPARTSQKKKISVAQVTQKSIKDVDLTIVVDRTAGSFDANALYIEGPETSGFDIGDWIRIKVRSGRTGTDLDLKDGSMVVQVDQAFMSLLSGEVYDKSQSDSDVLSVVRIFPVSVREKFKYFRSAGWYINKREVLTTDSTQLIGPRSPDEFTTSAFYHRWVSRGSPWRLKRGKIPQLLGPSFGSLILAASAVSTGSKSELTNVYSRAKDSADLVALRGFTSATVHRLTLPLS